MPSKKLRLRVQLPEPDPRPRLPPQIAKRLKAIAKPLAACLADIPITEIGAAFLGFETEYPPVMSLKQAAKLAHIAPSTLKRWVREKKFPGSVKTKKPLLFWRNRFVHDLFELT